MGAWLARAGWDRPAIPGAICSSRLLKARHAVILHVSCSFVHGPAPGLSSASFQPEPTQPRVMFVASCSVLWPAFPGHRSSPGPLSCPELAESAYSDDTIVCRRHAFRPLRQNERPARPPVAPVRTGETQRNPEEAAASLTLHVYPATLTSPSSPTEASTPYRC